MHTPLPLVRLLSALLLVLACTGLSPRATAQSVPHLAAGNAQFVSQNDFVGTGRATHLGNYTETGHVDFAPTGNPDVLAVTGTAVYAAANGDQLFATITGTLNTATGVIQAALSYTGGTGRFATASGSSTLNGQMLGGGAVTVAVAGSLTF